MDYKGDISLKGKSICILHPSAPDSDFRLRKTVLALSSAGAEVTVLSYDENPERGRVDAPCRVLCYPTKLNICHPSNNRIWLLRVLWNSTILRVQELIQIHLNHWYGMAEIAVGLNADLYYFINVDMLRQAVHLKELTDKPIVYESYEYFPAELKNHSYHRSRKDDKLFKLEKEVVQKCASEVIVVGDEIAQGYVDYYGCKKPAVVYNVATSTVEDIRNTDAEVKFYFQSYLRPTYNIEALIEAFGKTRGSASLTIQGKAFVQEYWQALLVEIEKNPRANDIHLLDPCPHNDVVYEAGKYDVGLISISAIVGGRESASIRLSLRNKLFTYASAGMRKGYGFR